MLGCVKVCECVLGCFMVFLGCFSVFKVMAFGSDQKGDQGGGQNGQNFAWGLTGHL